MVIFVCTINQNSSYSHEHKAIAAAASRRVAKQCEVVRVTTLNGGSFKVDRVYVSVLVLSNLT